MADPRVIPMLSSAPSARARGILSKPEENPEAGQAQYRAEDLEGHRWMFAQAL